MLGGVAPANIAEEPIMNRTLVGVASALTARPSRRRRVRRAAVALVAALAAAAWVVIAGRSTLWVDELFSLAVATGHSLEHPAAVADERLGDWVEWPTAMPAQRYREYLAHDDPVEPIARVIRAVKLSDTSPPLYYLLLHYWTRALGTGDGALRLFSVVCALGSFPALIYLARRAGGPAAVVPVCVLFAVSPAAAVYSSEGRMYALVWLLGSAFMAFTLRAAQRRLRGEVLILWVVAGAAGLLTHYFFAFLWGTCVAWLALQRARWRTPAFWVAVLATAAIVAPWYMTIPESLAQWRVTAGWLEGRLGKRATVLGPLKLAWGLFSGHGDWDGAGRMHWLVTALLVAVALAVLQRGWRRMLAGPRLLLSLCVLSVCLGLLLFDLVLGTRATLFPRYALGGLPPALVLTAAGLARVSLRWRAVLVSLFVLAAAPAYWSSYIASSRLGHSFRAIAADLRDAGASDDVVALVHSTPSGVLGVSRYADPDARIASWVGQLGQRRVPESVAALTTGSAVVVFVRIHPVGAPAPEEDWLRDNATVVREAQRDAARLVTFRPPSGSRFGPQ